MPIYSAHDGTQLAYHVSGDGGPVICLPGGPMQDSVYLGDLGGLAIHRQLVVNASKLALITPSTRAQTHHAAGRR
jgi:pimeloyl-ACP methyl ester carboxylesterase